MPQSQTIDQPMSLLGRIEEHLKATQRQQELHVLAFANSFDQDQA